MNLKLRQSKKCYKCLKSEFYSYGQADECISQVLITSFFFFYVEDSERVQSNLLRARVYGAFILMYHNT